LTQRDPVEDSRDHARDADRALDSAASKLAFADEVEAISRRRVGLASLGSDLVRARSRGWTWGREWEASLEDLQRRADEVLRDVREECTSATNRLRARVDGCRGQLTRTAVTAANRGALAAIEEEARSVLAAIEAEERRIAAIGQPFVAPYDGLRAEVSEALVHLDRFEAAKFQLAPGEHPWLTAEATWQDAPGGAVNGFLYLSDRRIRFEQKETITTKKFLFFTASSEDKHACLIDEPVGNIARSDDSTKGLIFKDQLVTIGWQNARLSKSTFDINSGGTSKEWDGWIEELRSGQIAHRRSADAPPAGSGMPIDAPTACSACAAALDAPVRGMTVLICRYCGQRHDLRFA
jgi:hypothetical protein